MWRVLPDASTKQQGEFVLDLGCVGRLAGAELVNTHNRQYRDRSTRAFTLATALTYTGPWTQVLSQELENSRQQVDPLPLQTFAFSAVARFVKFKIVSWHDDALAGGGLQYFFPILGESLLIETTENYLDISLQILQKVLSKNLWNFFRQIFRKSFASSLVNSLEIPHD